MDLIAVLGCLKRTKLAHNFRFLVSSDYKAVPDVSRPYSRYSMGFLERSAQVTMNRKAILR